MRRTLLLLLFLLFFPAIALGAPAISFESLSYDFGIVGGTDAIRHVFDFSNSGDTELLIQKLSPS